MVGLATETDLERLRQMALLLEAENARLHRRLVELTRALATATGGAQAQLELELQRLQEQLAARTRALFGPSSERRGSGDDAIGKPNFFAALFKGKPAPATSSDEDDEGAPAPAAKPTAAPTVVAAATKPSEAKPSDPVPTPRAKPAVKLADRTFGTSGHRATFHADAT